MAKEVAEKKPTSIVSDSAPEFMKGFEGKGTEGLTATALSPPRLKMAQALSPELEEMPDLRPGMFFNGNSGVIYGPSVQVIPCWASESYYLFAPRVPGQNSGLLARADDGVHWNPPNQSFKVVVDKKGTTVVWSTKPTVIASGLDQWGSFDPDTNNSPPAAVYAINSVMLVPTDLESGAAVFSFTRSAVKVGKKFASSLKMSSIPSFGRVFELTSIKVEGPSGPYFEPRTQAAGFVGDVKLFEEAKGVYNALKTRGLQVDIGAEAAHEMQENRGSSRRGPAESGDENINY